MSKHIYNGPSSVRIWLSDGGKLTGLSWGCPPGGCREWRGKVRECPHRSHSNRLCIDHKKCREAMDDWAVQEFVKYAQLYRERT